MRIVGVLLLMLTTAAAAQDALVVRDIEITGLRRTRRWTVERELWFAAGDTITPQELTRAGNRVRNLSVFSDVHIASDSGGVVTVNVAEVWPLFPLLTANLAEGQLGDLVDDPRSFFDKVTVYAGAGHVNFRGNADRVYVLAQFGAAEGIAAGYRTRWLSPELPLELAVDVENLRISDRRAAVADSSEQLRNVKYALTVGTHGGAHSRFGLEMGYRAVRGATHYAGTPPHVRTVWFSPYVVADHRDLEWYPVRGAYFRAIVDRANGDAIFTRVRTDLRGYLPLTDHARPVSLVLRLAAATSSRATPYWWHYYYGFNTGLRGYSTVKSESSRYVRGDAELRFPLTRESTYDVPLLGRYGRRWPFGIYGVLFAQRSELVLADRFSELAAAGGGLRFRVPYVEILELAAAVNRDGDMDFTVTSGITF